MNANLLIIILLLIVLMYCADHIRNIFTVWKFMYFTVCVINKFF